MDYAGASWIVWEEITSTTWQKKRLMQLQLAAAMLRHGSLQGWTDCAKALLNLPHGKIHPDVIAIISAVSIISGTTVI